MTETPRVAVVRGLPDETELAAVTVVLIARLRSLADQDGNGGEESAPAAEWTARRPRRPHPVTWTGV